MSESSVIFPHAHNQLAVVRHRGRRKGVINESERWTAILEQSYLVIQQHLSLSGQAVVVGAVLHVEDPVWRGAGCRRKYPTIGASGVQARSSALVSPIRSQRIGDVAQSERRTSDVEALVVRAEGQMAVRSSVGCRKALVVQHDRERKCNLSVAIIAMAANVCHTWDEGSRAQREVVRSRANDV